MDRFLLAHPRPLQGKLDRISSNMQDLTVWWIPLPKSPAKGGALVAHRDLLIVIQPSGEILWLNTARLQGPYATKIAAPMNASALASSGIASTPGLNLEWFRAAGAYVEERGGRLRLFVSHHVFDEGCFFLQVSAADLAFDPEAGLDQISDWQRIFRPDPCVRIGDASDKPFAGHQAGGIIVSLDRDDLLVTYGDHEIDGRRSANSPQDVNSPYGKIWKIAKDGSSARVYAMGVRNPQGLFVDRDGRIWESEHGPQGGDEINLVVDGANFGWPEQTYGVLYGDQIWPLNPLQGSHSDPRFKPPIFAWVPSIAPSNLTQVASAKFPLWNGDLLLATLRDQSLRRLRPDGDRIVYDERIGIGQRIRNIVSLDDGRIAVLAEQPLIGIIDDPGPKLRPEPEVAATSLVETEGGQTLSPHAGEDPQVSMGSHSIASNDATLSDGLFAPLAVPFATGAPRRVRAFERGLPGFWIGFQPDSNAQITVAQRQRETQTIDAPGSYALEVAVETAGASRFVTFETAVDVPEPIPLFADITLTGRLNRKKWVSWQLSIPIRGGSESRVNLGGGVLAPETSTITTRSALDLPNAADIDRSKPARIIMSLPREPGTMLRLEDYRVVFSEAAALRQ